MWWGRLRSFAGWLASYGLAFALVEYLTQRFGFYLAGGAIGVGLGLLVIAVALLEAREALRKSPGRRC